MYNCHGGGFFVFKSTTAYLHYDDKLTSILVVSQTNARSGCSHLIMSETGSLSNLQRQERR